MKKLSWLLCLIAVLVVVPVSSAFAETKVSYDSGASVGFYGEYKYPTNPSPENPSDDEGSGLTPGSGAATDNGTPMPILPQTGDSVSSGTTLIGLLFISFAFLLIYKRRWGGI